uniref:Uncharacterized protein n=1 Tax=Manihot esculenta TaxID=3983 RepID=A0A2C9V6H7_MANES
MNEMYTFNNSQRQLVRGLVKKDNRMRNMCCKTEEGSWLIK